MLHRMETMYTTSVISSKKTKSFLEDAIGITWGSDVKKFLTFHPLKIGFLGHFLTDWAEIFCGTAHWSRNLG